MKGREEKRSKADREEMINNDEENRVFLIKRVLMYHICMHI